MAIATVRFDGSGSSVALATGFGPRVVALLVGDRNLFAELSDDAVPGAGGRPYPLRGGHRLWVAPETRDLTYQHEEARCTLTRTGDCIEVDAPPDGAGIAKAITITGRDDGWVVDHTLTNRGRAPIRVSAWAVTSFRLGGTVTVPFSVLDDGATAARAVVLWPATDPADERLRVRTEGLSVAASSGGPLRIGVGGAVSAVRYELEGIQVEKRILVDPDARYPDLGAVIQVMLRERSCEIGTLGPVALLTPGGSVSHREEWVIS